MNLYQNKLFYFTHKNSNGKIVKGFDKTTIYNNVIINLKGETVDNKNYKVIHTIRLGNKIFQKKYNMTNNDIENILKKNPKDLLKNLSNNSKNNKKNENIIDHRLPDKSIYIKLTKETKPKELYEKYSFDQLLIAAKNMGIKVTKKEGGYYNKKELARKIIRKKK